MTFGGDLPAEVSAEARILPGDRGERRVTARLASPRAGSLADWRIAAGELRLDQPAVDQLVRRIAGLYPRLLDPAAIPELPPLGLLVAKGRFQGEPADPDVTLDAELLPHPGGRAHAGAVRTGRRRTAAGRDDRQRLEVGHFTPDAAGRLEWRGSVRDPLGAASGRLELTLRDLAFRADGTPDVGVGGDRARRSPSPSRSSSR